MHIFFSGIGGAGIGPLALIAKQAGHTVSGSDKQDSQYIEYLQGHGITDIHIGQTEEAIAGVHQANPIDWYVYSSAIIKENPDHPELRLVESKGIRCSKRDELLNQIIKEKNLKLIAVAGTHGKTTTTAMTIWLFKQLDIPISYSVGAKISFGEIGHYDARSEYFVYECDEYDRNFLAFHPYISLISGVAWDHHEVFPTLTEYNQAFRDFLSQSQKRVLWQTDYASLALSDKDNYLVLDESSDGYSNLALVGEVNRRDAWLVVNAVHLLTKKPLEHLVELMNTFPGLSRRMEQLKPNLYSEYAHTPEKIIGAMGTAHEMAKEKGQKVVVVYEPLTNRRAHYTKEQHTDVFMGASAIYWVPSYLAREDPALSVLTPDELIKSLSPSLQEIAKPMELNEQLKKVIESHLVSGDMIVAMSGGGGHSLDEWLRREF